jgi:hypothetical protein
VIYDQELMAYSVVLAMRFLLSLSSASQDRSVQDRPGRLKEDLYLLLLFRTDQVSRIALTVPKGWWNSLLASNFPHPMEST